MGGLRSKTLLITISYHNFGEGEGVFMNCEQV